MGRVLVIGGSNTDLVCRAPRLPVPGETINGSSFDVFAGGKGANQAVAAARAGADVVFGGAVGSDDFGSQRRADLMKDGVDVSCTAVVDGVASGVALIVVDDAGENQIVVIPGANGLVSDAMIERAFDEARANVTLLVLEIPFESLAHAVRRSSGRMTTIVNAAPFDHRIVELLPLIDVLICNETEAASILGQAVSHGTARDGVQRLRAMGCGTAIITLGRHGAFVADDDGVWSVPAPDVSVVDTTAAGDAFCGALAASLAEGVSMVEAVQFGVAAGALAVTKTGAQPSLPYRREIAERVTAGIG